MDVASLTAGRYVDVAIVGGGVAGLACAIEAAQRGLTAIVVDRPSPRLHPGECLHPGAGALLRRLGLDCTSEQHGISRPLGMWHTNGGEELRFVPYGQDRDGPWRGYQLRRSRLLARRASELGVRRFRFMGRAGLVHVNGSVTGLALADRTVRAGYVIDAAGGAHWIARKLGIGIGALSHPLYVRWGYVRQDKTAWDHVPWLDMCRSGWVWRARFGTDVHAWVQLGDDLKQAQLPAMGGAALPLCSPRGADASWRILDRCAGPGWIAVGDAAAVHDPISGDGVLRAFTTGIAAAALRAGARPLVELDAYDALLRVGVTRRAEQLRQYVPWVGVT